MTSVRASVRMSAAVWVWGLAGIVAAEDPAVPATRLSVRLTGDTPPALQASGTADLPDGAVLSVTMERIEESGGDPARIAQFPISFTCEVLNRRFETREEPPEALFPGCYRCVVVLDPLLQGPELRTVYARRHPPPPVETFLGIGRGVDLVEWLDREAERVRAGLAGVRKILDDLTEFNRNRVRNGPREEELSRTIEALRTESLARSTRPPYPEAHAALVEVESPLYAAVPRDLRDEDGRILKEFDGKSYDPVMAFDLGQAQAHLKEASDLLPAVEKALARERTARLGLGALGLLLRARRSAAPEEAGDVRTAELAEDAGVLAKAVDAAAGETGAALRMWCGKFQTTVSGWSGRVPPDAAVQIDPLAAELERIRGGRRRDR